MVNQRFLHLRRHLDPHRTVPLAILIVLLLIPLWGEIFYTRLFTRIMIYAIVALSLDLILGYGGMVSLGHAAFLGIGAYTVGIASALGIESAFVTWPLAMAIAMLMAIVIGAVSLRTTGAYFIMITLAFAQMAFYFFVSLKGYGGSDGMPLPMRSTLAGLVDLGRHVVFYYVVLALMLVILFFSLRLVSSQFGRVIQGIRDNERRMRSLGFSTFRYKLICFVISAAIAGLAGALMANQTLYVSPALMHWTQSGEILIMVILGGMRSLIGPMIGAAVLLLAEEIFSSATEHWMIFLGPLLIMIVLWGRNGLYGLMAGAKNNG